MLTGLKRMGARAVVKGENIIIEGSGKLKGCTVDSFSDHRTALSMIVAGLAARGTTKVNGTECIRTSFPGFLKLLKDKILN
jgi:3-phosphoshikimate 1-carboxyvinyltransferase